MPRTRATRERIAAIAATAEYNPHEADNARRMLEAMPETRLEVISADIKDEWGKGIEAQFAIGRLLNEAATLFTPSARNQDEAGRTAGSPFGEWFRAQDFPFNITTAWRLRTGFEREGEVRAFIASQSTSTSRTGNPGRGIGVATAVEYMNRRAKVVEQLESGTYQPATSLFTAFAKAVEPLIANMSQLPNDELAALAEWVRQLVVAYNAVRASR